MALRSLRRWEVFWDVLWCGAPWESGIRRGSGARDSSEPSRAKARPSASPAKMEVFVFHQSRRGRLLSQEGDKVPHTILISLAWRNSRVAPSCARRGENGIIRMSAGVRLRGR